jgi:CheY-like chemotaxis protein
MASEKELPPILLVEDDPVDVALFRRGLRILRPFTDLTVARDGDEAVEMLAGRRGEPSPFSHVVLDLKLPKRSGLEVLEWIRGQADLRGVRVVMLTSSQLTPDVERARRAGLDRYFVKPPDFTGLLDVVREILREWVLLP